MPEIPETAAVVVDYLKEEFKGSKVPSDPMYEERREVYTFKVDGPDRQYQLGVAHGCLDDFSASELQNRLRTYLAAEAMRRSATGSVSFTTSGVALVLPPKS